jgi:hypothetical protein
MMSILEYAQGCAALAWLLACAFFAASRLERWLVQSETFARRGLALGLLAWALLVVPMLVLGAAGWLRLPALLVVESALAAIVFWTSRGRSRRERPPRPALDRVDVGLLFVYGVAALYLVAEGLSKPPLTWDTLYYHLPFAAEWLRAGELVPLGHPSGIFQSYFPATGELASFLFLLPFENDLWSGLAQFPLIALQGFALYRIAVRAGAAHSLARFAPLLYLLTPCVARFVPAQYVEPSYGAAFFAAVAFLCDYRDERRPVDLFLLGVALSLLVGIKYTGLLTALPLGAFAIVYAARAPKPTRRTTWTAFAAGVLLLGIGAYWYWRNLALTGHPFFPMPVRVFGWEIFPGVAKALGTARLGHDVSILSALPDLLGSGELWRAVIGITEPDLFELGIGPKAVVLACVVLAGAVLLVRRPLIRLPYALFGVALVVFLTTPFWLLIFLYVNMRFSAPVVGLAAVLAVAAADASPATRRAAPFVALACIVPDIVSMQGEAPARFWILAAVGIAIGATIFVARGFFSRLGPSVRRTLVGVVAFGALAAGYALHQFREETRLASYQSAVLVHRTAAHLYARGWAALERATADLARSRRVRLAHTGAAFLYPLYGRRFERDVFYVPINARAGAIHDYPRAEPRAEADEQAWLANLARWRADFLLVQHPDPGVPGRWPVERSWAERHPERLAPLYGDAWVRLYRVQ